MSTTAAKSPADAATKAPVGYPTHVPERDLSPFRLPKNPPGPRGIPVLGVAPAMALNFWECARKIADEYGDIARLPFPTRKPVYLISNADLVGEVFVRRPKNHWKGQMLGPISEGLPASPMPTSDGEPWRKVRSLAQPHFTMRSMKTLNSVMQPAIDEHIDSLDALAGTGETIKMEAVLSTMTMDVLMRAMFTRRRDPRQLLELGKDYRSATLGSAFRWALFWAPSVLRKPFTRSGDQSRDKLVAFIRSMVAERRANPTDDPDLLNALLNATGEDGTLSDDQLTAELYTLVLAGFETTAAALSWTLALLSINPAACERAEAEADSIEGAPGFDDLGKLTYLRACFDEAQRIQGIPFYSRDSYEEQELGGYRIPANSILLASPYALQHDPRYWPEPDKFSPERWLEGETEKNAWLPFGVGPRRCLGMHMANTEATLFLGQALQRFRFRTAPGFTPKRYFHLSTSVKGGCEMTIERRVRTQA
ncbi:cytochrome P450 [Nocardia sp. NPDC050630]|uniref:cytochrome P450 n=1 Tax=Nocardia sp. NPDC050630 TaxID=3364321 RepID=UPI00379B0C52